MRWPGISRVKRAPRCPLLEPPREVFRPVFSVLKQGLAECDLRNLAHSKRPWHGEKPRGFHPMSWSELERFVADVEADVALQRALKHCRSRKELILAARRLGYRITRMDLQRAWQEERLENDRQVQG